MSTAIGRRGLLRGLAMGAAGAVLAPAAVRADETTREPVWADEWPPTARPGRLVRCEAAPGYLIRDGIPALFFGCEPVLAEPDPYQDPGPLYRIAVRGVTGFPVEREIEPTEGMHVIEIDLSPGGRGRSRYAVVRGVS